MMSQQNGLGSLEMGVAWDHHLTSAVSQRDKRALRSREAPGQAPHDITGIQAQVKRHLIIAAARRVQGLGDRPDQPPQHLVNLGVDILRGRVRAEPPACDAAENLPQSVDETAGVASRDDAARPQHGRVGDGADHVVFRQAMIHRDAGGEPLHHRIRPRRKPSTPKFRVSGAHGQWPSD
jgi:hypothetical protein